MFSIDWKSFLMKTSSLKVFLAQLVEQSVRGLSGLSRFVSSRPNKSMSGIVSVWFSKIPSAVVLVWFDIIDIKPLVQPMMVPKPPSPPKRETVTVAYYLQRNNEYQYLHCEHVGGFESNVFKTEEIAQSLSVE